MGRPSVFHRFIQPLLKPRNIASAVVVMGLILTLAACGKSGGAAVGSGNFIQQYVLPEEPTQDLTANSPPLSTKPSYYSVYQILSAKFSASNGRKEISARVMIQSTAGDETVDLLGKIRADGTASLIDINPTSTSQFRAIAEAYCVDPDSCTKIILDVFIKVGKHTVTRQFVSALLAKPPQTPLAPEKEKPQLTLPAAPAPVTNPAPTDAPAAKNQDSTDVVDTDADTDELAGQGEEADYVGAPPNTDLLKKLLQRPADQETPIATEPVGVPPVEPPALPLPPLLPPTVPPPPPQTAPESPAKPVSPKPAPAQPAPAKPPAPKVNPKAKAPPPLVAEAKDIPKPASATELEQQLAPLMNLVDGGTAHGFYSSGHLDNPTALATPPPAATAFYKVVHLERDTHWGTGMMISLIENAAKVITTDWYPDLSVMIGDIAFKHGGDIGTHASHQNGLDADIPYIGKTHFESIVSGQKVKPDFDYAKTWQFWRIVHSQKIILGGEKTTALGRVFVAAVVKRGFCAWAKSNNLLSNPDDADIMRRLSPYPGHEDHFHLRLKCSPHYPDCQKQSEPAAKTGC